MAMLAFLPWATIKETTTVGRILLVPWKPSPQPNVVDQILHSYTDRVGNPVKSATLLHYSGEPPTRHLDEAERLELFELAAVLSFVALARRSLWGDWHRPYANTHSFSLVIQAFDEANPTFLADVSRRRGGRLTAGFPRDLFQERMPGHVEPQRAFTIDLALVAALLAALNSPDRLRFEEALFSFNAANTDSNQVPEQHEIVALVGAFERLFQTSGKAEELAFAFTKLVAPYLSPDRPVHRTRINAFEAHHGAMRDGQRILSSCVAEAWLRDLFRTRNAFGHGRRANNKTSGWSASGHLLLGAFVLPLTVMALLAEQRLYAMGDSDKADLFAFPYLASLRNPLRWSLRRGSLASKAAETGRSEFRFGRALATMGGP